MAVILFRKDLDTEDELLAARTHLPTAELRSEVPANEIVVGRYSVLPFYRELERDLATKNSRLVNTYKEHEWIANFDYYWDLQEYTAESWDDYDFYKCSYEGPFVVKGKTNSRKHQWKTHMFAENKKRAIEIGCDLGKDSLISDQGIIYRKYIPLKTFEIGINGLPFTNEWRFFYLKEKRLSYAYYWTGAAHPELAKMTEEGLAFADTVAKIASEYATFFVLDIAEKADGGWILIEVNDGQMAGLSFNDPHVLYSSLKGALDSI